LIKRWYSRFADDLFFWLGALLLSAGAYFVFKPASLIILGVFCLVFSYLLGKARTDQ
jgi:hypothetical protein